MEHEIMADEPKIDIPPEVIQEFMGLVASEPMRNMATLDIWAKEKEIPSEAREEFVAGLCRLAGSSDNEHNLREYVTRALDIVLSLGPALLDLKKKRKEK